MSGVRHIRSVDGTRIGFVTSGTGPPLVMVHGSTADHRVLSRVVPLLEPHYTVHAVDRRGRGLSDDAASYDISLEYADLARVVDRLSAETGVAVSLYGHSYGAVCALGAAALTSNLSRLFLYEPGYRGVVLTPDKVLGTARRAGGRRRARRGARARVPVRGRHERGRGRGHARAAELAGQSRRSTDDPARVPDGRAPAGRHAAAADLPVPTVLLLGDRSTRRAEGRGQSPARCPAVERRRGADGTGARRTGDRSRPHCERPSRTSVRAGELLTATTNTTVIEKGPP